MDARQSSSEQVNAVPGENRDEEVGANVGGLPDGAQAELKASVGCFEIR